MVTWVYSYGIRFWAGEFARTDKQRKNESNRYMISKIVCRNERRQQERRKELQRKKKKGDHPILLARVYLSMT